MKVSYFLVCIASFLAFPRLAKCADNPYDPSTDLNTVFGSACPSFNGSINSLADSQGQSLNVIINNVRNDPACNSVSTVLNQMQKIDFTQFNSDKSNVLNLKVQVQDLQAAIASELAKPLDPNSKTKGYVDSGYLDPSYLASLKSSLISASQQLISNQGVANTDQSALRFKAIEQYQSLGSNVFSALSANQECSRRFPGLGVQVAGQIITTASTLASGFMAPILLATGGVFDSFMGYLAKKPLGKSFRKINNARITKATGCAIESLSATYCKARDLKLIASADCQVCNSNFEGGRIISQEMDALNSWLVRVKAGSNATSTGAATDKKTAKDLKSAVDKLKIDLDSDIAKSQQKVSLGTVTEAEEASNLLIKLAADASSNVMSSSSYSGSTATPAVLSRAFKNDPFCGPTAFLYTGGTNSECPGRIQTETCNQCVIRVFTSAPQLTITSLSTTETQMIKLANDYVNSEVSLVEETNPLDVLSQYTKRFKNFKTPENFVLDTRAYLSNLIKDPDFQHTVDQNDLKDLLKRLDDTACALNRTPDCPPPAAAPPGPPPSTSQAAIAVINDLHTNLIPSDDLFFVANTLSNLVKKDLDRRLEKGEINSNLADILLLSNSDTLGAVIQATMGRDAAITQAENAQGQTKTNMESLSVLFGQQILDSINDQSDPTVHSKSCIRAALIPGAPQIAGSDISKKCSGSIWKSVNANNDLKFDDIIKKPSEQRACLIYDFYRKSNLQDMGARTGTAPLKAPNLIK